MSEKLAFILNNISQYRSQLPAQITQHEIKGDCKERETEFGDYIGDFAYGFCSWYTSHIFYYNWTLNSWMRSGFVSKYC